MLPETPTFWQSKSLLTYILLPFSCLYRIGHMLKIALTGTYVSDLPVICIGGVIAGGSGKTPTVHALLSLIKQKPSFVNPVILTRGYGGVLKGPSLVDLSRHGAMDVGDEAMLHAAKSTTIVSKDRAAGARLAEAMGADIILLDDGLQNSSLAKTHSLLVIDAKYGIGNGCMLPAGPLREPYEEAKEKSIAIISTNGDFKADKPTFKTSLRVVSEHDMTRTYVGFAGLGHPGKFKTTLEKNAFKLAGFYPYPDHYRYTERDMQELFERAGPNSLITTEKDFVRIPAAYHNSIQILKIEITFDRPAELLALLGIPA